MNKTWYEKGFEKGYEEGLLEGLEQGLKEGLEQGCRAVLRDLLEERFGPVSAQAEELLQQIAADRLVELTKIVLRIQPLREQGLED